MAREKYRSGPTPRAFILAVIPLVVSGWLLWQGSEGLRRLAPGDALRLVAAYPPLVLGAATLLVTFVLFVQNVGKEITLGASFVGYKSGSRNFNVPMDHVVTQPAGNRLLRVLVLSDGKNTGYVLDAFLSDFDEVVEGMATRKKVFQQKVYGR